MCVCVYVFNIGLPVCSIQGRDSDACKVALFIDISTHKVGATRGHESHYITQLSHYTAVCMQQQPLLYM